MLPEVTSAWGRQHEDYNLRNDFNVMKAYSQSKLANILFARELADRVSRKQAKKLFERSEGLTE